MTKSKKLPQKRTQTYSRYGTFQRNGNISETDTTAATGTITSTHIFKK
ncbi:hypothetical protein [Pedobacter sp. KBS0701]|nr:hypothetical protein [Pedobacter sp. KBS0701]